MPISLLRFMLITSPWFEQTHHRLSRLHWELSELSKQKLPRANWRKCGTSRINSFLFMFSRCEAALNSRPARFREKTKLNLPTAERCLDAWKNVHTRLPYSNRRQSKRWICARALLNASLLDWKEPWKGAMSEHWRTRVRSALRYQQFPPLADVSQGGPRRLHLAAISGRKTFSISVDFPPLLAKLRIIMFDPGQSAKWRFIYLPPQDIP